MPPMPMKCTRLVLPSNRHLDKIAQFGMRHLESGMRTFIFEPFDVAYEFQIPNSEFLIACLNEFQRPIHDHFGRVEPVVWFHPSTECERSRATFNSQIHRLIDIPARLREFFAHQSLQSVARRGVVALEQKAQPLAAIALRAFRDTRQRLERCFRGRDVSLEKRGFSFGLTLSDFSGQPIFRPVFGFSEDDVPAFVNNLKSTNAFVRAATAEAVGEIHITAWNGRIVPVLLRLLEDNDIPVRNAAAQALKRIDPEAVAKVGVK